MVKALNSTWEIDHPVPDDVRPLEGLASQSDNASLQWQRSGLSVGNIPSNVARADEI